MTVTAHLRDQRGRLLPGQPPINPSGRPPVAEAVRKEVNAILQGAVPVAARRLAELVDHRDPRIALAASDIIMNRVFGKPLAQVEAKIETTNVQQAHLQILLELQARRDRNSGDYKDEETRLQRDDRTICAAPTKSLVDTAPAPIEKP